MITQKNETKGAQSDVFNIGYNNTSKCTGKTLFRLPRKNKYGFAKQSKIRCSG